MLIFFFQSIIRNVEHFICALICCWDCCCTVCMLVPDFSTWTATLINTTILILLLYRG
ncbi:hypothetical protein DAI22_01g429200 [Oryza sativa Japonica Group]|nr:hypothetical protein DAI22_01g429200 [Oryza sativa Japonica Group]